MKDSTGREIELTMLVEVPEPIFGDTHNCAFIGTVSEFHTDYVTVVDEKDNYIEIEPERLTILDAQPVKVSPEVIKRVIQDWIEEADCDTLLRIYNENFDRTIEYDSATYQFTVPIEEADRVGMEYEGNSIYFE